MIKRFPEDFRRVTSNRYCYDLSYMIQQEIRLNMITVSIRAQVVRFMLKLNPLCYKEITSRSVFANSLRLGFEMAISPEKLEEIITIFKNDRYTEEELIAIHAANHFIARVDEKVEELNRRVLGENYDPEFIFRGKRAIPQVTCKKHKVPLFNSVPDDRLYGVICPSCNNGNVLSPKDAHEIVLYHGTEEKYIAELYPNRRYILDNFCAKDILVDFEG